MATDTNKLAVLKVANSLGATLLPDDKVWELKVQIKSETSSRLYVVSRNKKTLQWGCSCPGYKNARNGVRKCKHLTTMTPMLEAALRPAKVGGR